MKDDNGKTLTPAQQIMRNAVRGDRAERCMGVQAQSLVLETAQDFTSTPSVERTDDMVHHPSHYTSHPSGVECIRITEHMNFNVGNAVKYLWRSGLKDSGKSIEDLEKARFYVSREIARISK
ncbi:DUF3310 domain-containing protein [Streptomyces tsukubensis]|uniref:DUF3310 domain-containing protein n=1 Tax=Streptomyces tsukubensis TaxID=83656 RepID=UPI0036AF38AE